MFADRTTCSGPAADFVKPAGFEALERLLKLLYETWLLAEIPAVDTTGRQLDTGSTGKRAEFVRTFDDQTPSVRW